MRKEGLSLQAQDDHSGPQGINTSGHFLASAVAGKLWVQGVTEKTKNGKIKHHISGKKAKELTKTHKRQ